MDLRIYGVAGKRIGGGESYMAALVDALSVRHSVRVVDSPDEANVCQANDRPYGPKLVYILQVPYGPFHLGQRILRGDIREFRHDLERLRLLADARRSSLVIVYSDFVRNEFARRGIDTTVLYPPVEDFASDLPKKKVVISVGRFFEKRIYNHKRYEDLIEAFKLFYKKRPGWEYRIIGGANPGELRYVEKLEKRALGYPIDFFVNAPERELRLHYGEATLFWHGAGLGATSPDQCEHFGISTVEAMSAGCVPIVPHGGGDEILSHWMAGYLYNTVDELVTFSMALADNPDWRERNASNGKIRAANFSTEKFRSRALAIFDTLEAK